MLWWLLELLSHQLHFQLRKLWRFRLHNVLNDKPNRRQSRLFLLLFVLWRMRQLRLWL